MGEEETIHRVTLGFEMRFGSRATRTSLPLVLPVEDLAVPGPSVAGPCRFRLHAPQAEEVTLVGDFNGWDPRSDPLRPAGDGWWEGTVVLPAGSFQYAYRVDGKLVTPPEADTVVEDGFGGANGVIQVTPAGG
jgi:hypothetical protein